jgi:hypothetical protein
MTWSIQDFPAKNRLPGRAIRRRTSLQDYYPAG